MASTPVTTGRCAPAWPKDALRISFGIIWLIDATLKWLPGFRSGYMDMIMGQAQGQPGWLKGWFTFWINLQHPQPMFFAYLVAAAETLIAVAVIAGFARKLTYISAAAFSVLIWATAEGFGGPYTSGSADIGTAVIYALVFLGLLALSAYAGPARYSVDYYLEQKISWWSKVAEVRPPVQNVPAPAAAAIIAGPAVSTAVVPQPRTAQPVISAPAVTASLAGPAGPAASDEQVPAGRSA
jgi:nitrite reductase (NO-forming)